jgi:hypothetical protein
MSHLEREQEGGPLTVGHRGWLERMAQAVSFGPGVYAELKNDRSATWQSILTWIGTLAVMHLLTSTIEGATLRGSSQLAGFWTVLLFAWVGVLFLTVGGFTKPITYTHLLRGIGFSMLGIIVPQAAILISNSISDGRASELVYWLLVLALLVWVLAMQVQAVREMAQVSNGRAAAAVIIPVAVIVAAVLVLAAWFAHGWIRAFA